MQKGLAPQVQYSNGMWYSMELHHPNGREGNNFWDFELLIPWDHSRVDPFRYWRP